MAQATRIDPGYFGQDFEEFIEPTSLSRSETISTSRESHWPKPPVHTDYPQGSMRITSVVAEITKNWFDIVIINHVDIIVDRAKARILRLEENWDDAGCSAYKEETIKAAAKFLHQLEGSKAIKVRIAPASEGSIDLHWKMDKFELLINFHPDNSVSYYGDDYNGNLIRGNSCPKPEFISCWMKHTSE